MFADIRQDAKDTQKTQRSDHDPVQDNKSTDSFYSAANEKVIDGPKSRGASPSNGKAQPQKPLSNKYQ